MTDWWQSDPVQGGAAQGAWWEEDKSGPTTIADYPAVYGQMRRESQQQIGRGVEQLKAGASFATSPTPEGMSPSDQAGAGPVNLAKGIGNIAIGGLGYVASPISAGLRTIVGKPLEERAGIPKEVSEFAAGMALPIPKRLPTGARPTAVPAREEIARASNAQYTEARAMGGEFPPEMTGALADHVRSTLRSKGAYEHLATQVHQTVDILRKDTPTSLDEVRSVLEGLSSLAADKDGKVRRAAGIASSEIKQFLARTEPEAAAVLAKATANKAAEKRAATLDVAGEVAGLRTGRAGYGGNAVNAMRQVLSPIVESAIKAQAGLKGSSQGFRADEIQAMKDIVDGTAATNVLRGFGQLSPSKGSIATGISIATGGLSAGIGAAANKLATVLTAKQIDRLNELVRKRSPAYQEAVAKAADKYFTAADEFLIEPSQAGLIRLTVSARALAGGLSRDGIGVTSGDFLRLLPGSVKAPAEDEQVSPERVVN